MSCAGQQDEPCLDPRCTGRSADEPPSDDLLPAFPLTTSASRPRTSHTSPLTCKRGKDALAIADQGGWARGSRSMNGYFQRVGGWEDNAPAGLTRPARRTAAAPRAPPAHGADVPIPASDQAARSEV